MTPWTLTPWQLDLLDRSRGNRLYTVTPYPFRVGWAQVDGRGHLAGVTVVVPLAALRVVRERSALCRELLEAQKELTGQMYDPEHVHLVNIPQGVTDCGKDAEGLAVTLSRSEATCPGCMPAKDRGDSVYLPGSLRRQAAEMQRQLREGKVLVSVDPGAGPDVTGYVEHTVERQVLESAPCGDGQVDAFLVGLAEIASATRDLAEAHRAVNGCADDVEDLVNDVARKLRERVKLLDVHNGEV